MLTRSAPARVDDLIRLGARFDREPGPDGREGEGPLSLAREGGQRVARSVRRADATGAEIVRALRHVVAPRVSRLPGIAYALATDPDRRVTGVWVVSDDELLAVEARAVLLATGGCGGLYAATTNPDQATGDGLSLAAASGAAVRDVEFVQFHPTGLAVEGSWRFRLTEALRGAGATRHAADGRRFLLGRHPDAELAPRHVVAKAILELEGGTAYLDATHLSAEAFRAEFPTVLAGARQHGFDLLTERVPVTPAAHYQVGGVRTDLDGRTSLRGLYAAGEVASTGLHGANRMASNSLAEAVVFGARSAAAIVAELPEGHGKLGDPPELGGDGLPSELRARLREEMLLGAGPVRNGAGLGALAARLAQLAPQVAASAPSADAVELLHAVRASRLIVQSALLRSESRGGHWREDHPERDPRWNGVHLERVGLPA